MAVLSLLVVLDGENGRSKLALDLRFSALVDATRCMPQSALPGPCVHARPVSCKAQPLTGFLLVFPRGNAPTTLWFSLPLAFFVRGLGLVLVLVGRALASGEVWLVVLVVLLDISKVGGGAQSRARDVCEVRIRLWICTERISHAEALSEAVVNSSSLLVRCVFVGDSSIFVTNILSLILGIIVAVFSFLAVPDTGRRKPTSSILLLVPTAVLLVGTSTSSTS